MSFDNLHTVFKALADPARRQILDILKKSPQTTGELVEQFQNIGRCAVMKHLKALQEAELVTYRREGKFRVNYLNPVPIRKVYQRWMIPLAESSSTQLVALKEHIESKPTKKLKENN